MKDPRVVLVTGVSGFLGRYVAREFFDAGWAVVGTDRGPRPVELDERLRAYYEMTLPSTGLAAVLTQHGPHACIHCAGGASVDDSMRHPEADFLAGPVITFELLEAVRRLAPECRVVLLSSAAVYGNPDLLPVDESQPPSPLSPYGFHKLQCEQLCAEYHRVYGTATAIARIFSAYGAGLRKQVLWDISRAALVTERLLLRGTGNESRDFVDGRDVAAGLRAIAEDGSRAAAVYNLASGEETTIRSLAALLLDALDIRRRVEFDGVVPPGTPLNWRADIRKIQGLGFTPQITLPEGVASFVRWRLSQQGR